MWSKCFAYNYGICKLRTQERVCVYFRYNCSVCNVGCFYYCRIKSAESRCLSRYLEENKVCTAKSIKALNTLIAASNRVESIGTSFNSYTNYAKPVSA